ncbi:uncharacterized protein LOC134208162 [Armigeres subalbatus]|uniref:uncharacterized protein LOC134208162 n=1 Tax=Armigeres subalbatus TaxID=124917 RepID=UPI002ED549F4
MSIESLVALNFPLELLDRIFAYLPLSDRKTASLVCRAWNELAFNRYLSNVVLNVTFDRQLVMRKYSSMVLRQYRHVSFSHCNYDMLIDFLDMFGTYLETFHSRGCLIEEQLSKVITRTPNLRHIAVNLTDSMRTDPGLIFPAVDHLTQLSAHFDNCSGAAEWVKLLRQLAPQLTHLELTATNNVIPIEELRFPKVEVLKLGGHVCVTWDSKLQKFFSSFKLLKDVKLEFNISQAVLDVLTGGNPGIEMLHFSYDVLYPDSLRLLSRLKQLRALSFFGSNDFRISPECPPLPSVKRLCLEIYSLNSKTSVFRSFRQLLPNVIDMSVKMGALSRPECILEPVCSGFTLLERLTISSSSLEIDSNVLFDALRHLDRLEDLTFRCTETTQEFMPPNKKLKRLKFESCHWLTDDCLPVLLEMCSSLKYLELKSCRGITSKAWEKIKVHCRVVNCIIPGVD